jgi:DNA-binding GntR family transcriptional regulator
MANSGTTDAISDFRRSRSEEVYQHIKQDIMAFRMLPGDRFTESELSERLGLSRTPVRQALHRLKQEGYLEVFFRSGWRVLPFDFKKYEQLYELRLILETASVQALCQSKGEPLNQTLQDLQLIWLVHASERNMNGDQVSLWDEAFHCSLVAAVGNEEMTRIHLNITEKIRMIRRLDFTQIERIHATYEEHAEILKAILSRRSEKACLLLRAHISSSQAEVRKITVHQWYTAKEKAKAQGFHNV